MDLQEKRMTICEHCAIYNPDKQQCSSTLWIDPKTNTAYTKKTLGAIKGCGCYIPSKIKREGNVCPANKW